MKGSLSLLVGLLATTTVLAAPVPTPAAPVPSSTKDYHVVEVQKNPSIANDKLASLLTEKLGAAKDKVQGLLEKLEQKGRAIMAAGPAEECAKWVKMFEVLGMKSVVRPLEDYMHGAKNWIQLYTTPPKDASGRAVPPGRA